MEILNQNAKINYGRLKQFIMRTTANELLALSQPCYYPKLKKNYFDMLHFTGLKEKDIKEYVKRIYHGSPIGDLVLIKDPITNFLIYIMHSFLNINDTSGYTTTMVYFILRIYANLIHKQFKFCNPYAFKYALENLAKTHLYIREKTIANSLFFMAKEMIKKYTKSIKDGNDPNEFYKLIIESRTRVSQSIKSFAELYYKAQEKGTIVRNPYESEDEDTGNKYQEQAQEKYQRIVESIAKKICVYKYIDKKAILEAKTITKINLSIATLLSNSVTDVKYLDNIKIIMKLFLKDITNVKTLCGKDYYKYIRDLMSIKRTSSTIYFKQQIGELIEKLIDDMNYREKYINLSSQSKFMINLYVALYLTMILKNTIC